MGLFATVLCCVAVSVNACGLAPFLCARLAPSDLFIANGSTWNTSGAILLLRIIRIAYFSTLLRCSQCDDRVTARQAVTDPASHLLGPYCDLYRPIPPEISICCAFFCRSRPRPTQHCFGWRICLVSIRLHTTIPTPTIRSCSRWLRILHPSSMVSMRARFKRLHFQHEPVFIDCCVYMVLPCLRIWSLSRNS